MKLSTLCYIKKNGKTLMLHRVKKKNDTHEGKRNGLGGKFEEGESPEECAIREIKEESGLNARNPKMEGMLTAPNFDGKDDRYVFLFTITDSYQNTITTNFQVEESTNEKIKKKH